MEEGIAALAAGDADRALERFQAAAAEVPSSPELQYDLGLAHLAKGQHDEAIAALTQAVSASDPTLRARALSAMGSVHAAKAGARLVSSGTTAGVANPLLSMTEDVVSLWGAVLSIFVPILTFTVAVGLLYFVVHRLGSRRRSGVGDRAVG